MQTKNAGTIKGLGIAVLALSIFVMLCCLLSFALLGITNAAFGEGAFMDRFAHELSSELDYAYGYGHGFGYDDYDMSLGIVSFVLSILGVLVGWELLSCIVSLIAGIVAMRQAKDIAKYGSIFSWAIAGAIASLLGGRIIATALLVVIAVFANKDKNAAETAQWHAQGNVEFTQPGYAQSSVSADPFYAAGATDASSFPQQPTPAASGYAQAQQPAAQQAYHPVQPEQPTATPYIDGINGYSSFGQTGNQVYPQPTQGYQQTYYQPMTSSFPAVGVPVAGGAAATESTIGTVDTSSATVASSVAAASATPTEATPTEATIVTETLVAEPVIEAAVDAAPAVDATNTASDTPIATPTATETVIEVEAIVEDPDTEDKRD